MSEIKILVSDDVSESGLEPLRAAGFEVVKRTGLKGGELLEAVRDCEGLVVRSETKVTAELLDAATRLRAVGRAGVGVDNIDVAAATARGVIVMNAPDGNTLTTAEHTMALLLALARRVPQAHASLRAGRWERKKFIGVELRGKTLGVVGLGRIGRVVAHRARAFGMKVVAFDPFVAPEQAGEFELELLPLTEVCPPADYPLLQLEEVTATPHLGASTREAQEGVALTVAEQMRDYFLTGALRGAVNAPALGAQELHILQPYLTLAGRLGRFQAQLIDEPVREVRIEFAGEIADMDAAPVARAFLAGLLRDVSARVNVVNAFLIAEERGIKVTTTYKRTGGEFSPA